MDTVLYVNIGVLVVMGVGFAGIRRMGVALGCGVWVVGIAVISSWFLGVTCMFFGLFRKYLPPQGWKRPRMCE